MVLVRVDKWVNMIKPEHRNEFFPPGAKHRFVFYIFTRTYTQKMYSFLCGNILKSYLVNYNKKQDHI